MNAEPARSKILGFLAFAAGAIVLVLIAGRLISSRALPTFSDYLAAHASPADLLSIAAPEGIIRAFQATSTVDQEKGLGDRDRLPIDEGMLFEFPEQGSYGFWMKDMRFPLDMVWIDAGKKVVAVDSNIATDTYPSVILPPSPVSYVLEMDAGQAYVFGIATGTELSF